MALNVGCAQPMAMQRPAASSELAHQVAPLVRKLPAGHRNGSHASQRADFAAIECVAAPGRFSVYLLQVRIDGRSRKGVRAEPLELRMVPVTAGFAAQDGLCEQRLAPERDQPLGIEIARMQAPEPHGSSGALTARTTCRRRGRFHRGPSPGIRTATARRNWCAPSKAPCAQRRFSQRAPRPLPSACGPRRRRGRPC